MSIPEFGASPAMTTRSEGTVKGFVERLTTERGRHRFTLIHPVNETPIPCQFTEDMLEQVRLAVKRNVTVTGSMDYHADNPYPVLVDVKALEIHPPDDELPRLTDLRGLMTGGTNGQVSAEFVRALRDEQEA